MIGYILILLALFFMVIFFFAACETAGIANTWASWIKFLSQSSLNDHSPPAGIPTLSSTYKATLSSSLDKLNIRRTDQLGWKRLGH